MPKPKQFLRGDDLLRALLVTTAPLIKWISAGASNRVTPAQAYCIAKASSYEGKYHNGRVFFIREVKIRPDPVADVTYWDGRGILHWNKPVDKQTVAVWDRYFKAHPSPAPVTP